MTRASVALAQMRRLRTWVSSRRSTTPNAPLKADRQEASVPLRADGSPVWAFRSPGLRIAAPARLPEAFSSVAFVGRGLPAHSCATAPVSHRIPLVPAGILALLQGEVFLGVPLPHQAVDRLDDALPVRLGEVIAIRPIGGPVGRSRERSRSGVEMPPAILPLQDLLHHER